MSARGSTIRSPSTASGAMKPGVPLVNPPAPTRVITSLGSSTFRTRPKSSTLRTSNSTAAPAGEHVRRLHVAVDQAAVVGVGERIAGGEQEVDRPFRGHRAGLLDQRLEVAALEELHHVVEHAVVADAEVVEDDGVRRRQHRRRLRLALEAAQGREAERVVPAIGSVGADQLDRRRAPEHPVPRGPDLAHATRADLADQLIGAHAPGLGDAAREEEHAARAGVGDAHADEDRGGHLQDREGR